MAQDIQKYFQVMQQRDFLRNHQYRVSGLIYEGFSLGEDSLVYLKTAEVPNRTINVVSVPFMGLNFSVPGTAQYAGTMELTFYCDQPQIIRSFFEAISFATFDDRTSGGAYTVTFPASVKWAGGTAPTLTASGYDDLGFFTIDGGTTWQGFVLGKAMA